MRMTWRNDNGVIKNSIDFAKNNVNLKKRLQLYSDQSWGYDEPTQSKKDVGFLSGHRFQVVRESTRT